MTVSVTVFCNQHASNYVARLKDRWLFFNENLKRQLSIRAQPARYACGMALKFAFTVPQTR